MQFNDLLRGAGYDLAQVAVMLHQPAQSGQRNALLSLVMEAPHLFELYQDNHPKNPEATLKARKFAASFVVNDAGEARFVGLYRVAGWQFQSHDQMLQDHSRRALGLRISGEGVSTYTSGEADLGRAVFQLDPLEDLAALKGRLIVPRPAGRSYVRLAENCVLPILRVEETARFVPRPPDWREMVLDAPTLRALPKEWAARLQEWRGIYLIVDQVDGARYVGSAYGQLNLLARWLAHVAKGKGITAELSARDPGSFRFSILERTSPDMAAEEVIAIEQNWKRRLDTFHPHGLNRN